MKHPNYITWLYSLNGVRHRLYTGKSHAKAIEMLIVGEVVIHAFKKDATILVLESSDFLEGKEVYRRDYFAGWWKRNDTRKHNLRLAMETQSSCICSAGFGMNLLCPVHRPKESL